MMTLSIVSHRQGPLVALLLADLARIGSRTVSAIVVTCNVDEAPLHIPPALAPMTTVIDNPQPRGFGANHNAAFAQCRTSVFAILNPDLRIPDDPFPALLAALTAGETGASASAGVALVAPRIVAPDGHDEDAARELITPWRLILRRLPRHERVAAIDFDWLAGMFFVVRSDAFRAIGGFDRRYFMYCEDFDLCARLRLAGWSLGRIDTACVVHAAQRESHRSIRHLLWHVASIAKMWLSPTFWRYRRLLAGRPR